TMQAHGINFALLSRHATRVTLVLFPLDGPGTLGEVELQPRKHRTGDHWHVQVAGLPLTFRYGWRVDGPRGDGHCYDPEHVLLDPAATAISDGATWRSSPDIQSADRRATQRRSLFFRRPFDWQEDAPPLTALED